VEISKVEISELFFRAVRDGDLTTVQQMLREGTASTKERNCSGKLIALSNSQFSVAQWLLEHGGSTIRERANYGQSVWANLRHSHTFNFPSGNRRNAEGDSAALPSMLRVMVLREDPPPFLVAALALEHVRVVEEGARLRARLPAYLARWWALLDEHCPLIPPLLALVRGHDQGPITTKEIWATGLGTDP
jgi:hypothetical protein